MSGSLSGLAAIVSKSRTAEVVQSAPEPQSTVPSPAEPTRQPGKSRNDDFERLTVYVRKDTKKEAARKWEDATGRDTSDLIQHLLTKYLNT
jgi:hypothetical protein